MISFAKSHQKTAMMYLFLFMFILPFDCHADRENTFKTLYPDEQKKADALQKILNLQEKAVDRKLIVSAKTVINELKKDNNIVLVDIRKPEDFKKLKIANSLNIPLHFVKTKAFLKNKTVVLTGKGFSYAQQARELNRLKKAGFSNVYILENGLSGWKEAGGKLEGDPFAIKNLQMVSPSVYFQERHYQNKMVINVSGPEFSKDKHYLPEGILLSHAVHSSMFLERIKNIIQQGRSKWKTTIMLVNADGNYGKIQSRLAEAGVSGIFYLEGGLLGYKEFLDKQARMKRPDQLKSLREKCQTCPDS